MEVFDVLNVFLSATVLYDQLLQPLKTNRIFLLKEKTIIRLCRIFIGHPLQDTLFVYCNSQEMQSLIMCKFYTVN